jgi:hypothetical protein
MTAFSIDLVARPLSGARALPVLGDRDVVLDRDALAAILREVRIPIADSRRDVLPVLALRDLHVAEDVCLVEDARPGGRVERLVQQEGAQLAVPVVAHAELEVSHQVAHRLRLRFLRVGIPARAESTVTAQRCSRVVLAPLEARAVHLVDAVRVLRRRDVRRPRSGVFPRYMKFSIAWKAAS